MLELEAGMPTKRKFDKEIPIELCSISHWPPVIHHVATNSDNRWRIWILKLIQALFSLLHLQGKLICFLIKYSFYIQVLFTVSNLKHSKPIQLEESGSSFHIQIMMLWVFLYWIKFRKGLVFHFLGIFFPMRLWAKRKKLKNKQTKHFGSHNSNLLISIMPAEIILLDWEKATQFL